MANKYRGEVEVDLGGKTRVIKFDINSVSEMEQAADKPISVIFSDGNVGIFALRMAMFYGLKAYNRRLTINEVGKMMHDDMRKDPEKLTYFGERIGYAMQYFSDPTQEEKDRGDPEHPLFDGVKPIEESSSTAGA